MNEDNSDMEWQPTTPPKSFDPYPHSYIPGGWPAEPPTPTANAFARSADPSFFLPAAKRVCRGAVAALSFAIVKPSYTIVRSVRAQRKQRRSASNSDPPIAQLRESPFQRAIKHEEGPENKSIKTTPYPLIGTRGESISATASAARPPQRAVAGFRRPRRGLHFTPHINTNIDSHNSLFYDMPIFLPPREDTPRGTSSPSTLETLTARDKPNLHDAPFPNLIPDGVRIPPSLPTPPDSPSTQLIADLQNPGYHKDEIASDVSSEVSDSWMPIGFGSRRRRVDKKARRSARFAMPAKSRTTKGNPLTNGETSSSEPQLEADTVEQNSQTNHELSEQEESKPEKDVHIIPHPDDVLVPTETKVLRSPDAKWVTPVSDQTELSSTVPWSPRDDLSLNLGDFKSPKPPEPSPKPSTPRSKAPSPPADFHRLYISSRFITPQKQAFASPKADRHSGERTVRKTRAAEAKDKWQLAASEYERLSPLAVEWQARVKEAVQKGHGRLTASDFARVVPYKTAFGTDNWLNDEVINEYLNVITAHGKKQDRQGQVPSHHAFSSFFYNKLVKDGPDSVKRWATRGKIGGKNLLQTRYVFIPINHGSHWTLAVVSGENKTIAYYNSLAGPGRAKLEAVKGWVRNELGSAFKEEEWALMEGESPMQANNDDCGVFTITSARQIMLGYTPMTYDASMIDVQRKRIVAEIVNGELLKAV